MLISIVTAVYNRAETISHAMESVFGQTHCELEYIVVDGASNDGTVDLIKTFEDKTNHSTLSSTTCRSFRWVSEPDCGVYDAMNKGLRMSKGEVVAILNSDDFYHRKDTLSRVAAAFEADPELQVVYGDNLWVKDGALDKVIRYANGNNWNWFAARCGVMPPHNTFFVRKAVFEKYGYYDTSYKICADFERELMFLVKLQLKSKYLAFDFTTMRKGGLSSSGLKGYWTSIKECHRACKQVGVFTCWPMQFLKLAIKLPQKWRNPRTCTLTSRLDGE